MIIMQECFNSPYGHVHFPVYAENIGYFPGKPYSVPESKSESVQMLSSAAKESGTWLIGGSIPERDLTSNKVYNTCTVYNPKGKFFYQMAQWVCLPYLRASLHRRSCRHPSKNSSV